MQANIQKFFSKTIDRAQVLDAGSGESEPENFESFPSRDIAYYENLLKEKDDLKKWAKVKSQETGISECWKHFGSLHIKDKQILAKYKFCKICFEEKGALKGFSKSTATTNYLTHLRTVHNLNVKASNQKKASFFTQSALEATSTNNCKYQNGRRIAEMCCWDLQPFKIVERPGFKKFVNFLNSKTVLPTDRTISNAALNDVYNIYLEHVKTALKNSPRNITIVTDMWSDNYKHLSYINLKVHFCKDFIINVVTLKTEVFPRPHTALAVSDKINEALLEFSLSDKHISAVTDGGTNIVAALRQQNIVRYGCIAHALHRFLMHDVLQNKNFSHINKIIFKLKQIYRSLIYNGEEIIRLQNLEEQSKIAKIVSEAGNVLENIDSNEEFSSGDDNFTEAFDIVTNTKQSGIKNSVPTRWNSTLIMVESFNQNIHIINIALLKAKQEPLLIPEMEKKILNEFGKYLKIFENATNYLQGQYYPTISSCIFFSETIVNALKKAEVESCFELTIDLCNFSIDNFARRFKILKIHVVAALMDPCQKKWETLNKYLKKIPPKSKMSFELNQDVSESVTRESIIFEEIQKVDSTENYQTFPSQPSTSKALEPKEKKQKISSSRKKMLDVLRPTRNSSSSLDEEIKQYLLKDVEEVESLDWWKQHEKTFPNVAKLANFCLGIPATSASSEQAFSAAGNCVNATRSRLNPATVKKQLFVHDNRSIVEPYLLH